MRGGGGAGLRLACSVAGLTLPLWCPRGGLGGWGCRLTLPLTCLFAPYPPAPLPRRGRGRPRLFHARGSAPCIPGAEPGRHGAGERATRPAGGLVFPVAGLTLPLWCPRGACLFGCLLPLPLTCLFTPYPPDPLPRRGRGRPRLFHARGSAPCIPGAEPGRHGAGERATRPAGGLAFPVAGLTLPLWCPRGGLAVGVAALPCL